MVTIFTAQAEATGLLLASIDPSHTECEDKPNDWNLRVDCHHPLALEEVIIDAVDTQATTGTLRVPLRSSLAPASKRSPSPNATVRFLLPEPSAGSESAAAAQRRRSRRREPERTRLPVPVGDRDNVFAPGMLSAPAPAPAGSYDLLSTTENESESESESCVRCTTLEVEFEQKKGLSSLSLSSLFKKTRRSPPKCIAADVDDDIELADVFRRNEDLTMVTSHGPRRLISSFHPSPSHPRSEACSMPVGQHLYGHIQVPASGGGGTPLLYPNENDARRQRSVFDGDDGQPTATRSASVSRPSTSQRGVIATTTTTTKESSEWLDEWRRGKIDVQERLRVLYAETGNRRMSYCTRIM